MKTAYSGGKPFDIGCAVFENGRIASIIGKNGSGKTTLLKAMVGLLPYSGSISIDGKECRDYKRSERSKKVSYLPQLIKPAAMDVETLAEHGRFSWQGNFRRPSEEDKRRVEEALFITHMDDYRHRELTELSGGELRRAYLSMVIAQNADIMLLDEPTTYMDIENQKMFYEIICRLVKAGHGVVMTCHNIEQAFTFSDQILIMKDRNIVMAGEPETLEADGEALRAVFGASVKREDRDDLIFPYVLVK